MAVSILDYSFRSNELVVIFNTGDAKPSPNTFQFNPRPCDVIEMAMDLDIIENIEDYDNGLAAQELRVGFDFFGTDKIVYFGYTEVISWIGGDALEYIALRLAEKEYKRICKEENTLVESLI
jgi:hypothetical protein